MRSFPNMIQEIRNHWFNADEGSIREVLQNLAMESAGYVNNNIGRLIDEHRENQHAMLNDPPQIPEVNDAMEGIAERANEYIGTWYDDDDDDEEEGSLSNSTAEEQDMSKRHHSDVSGSGGEVTAPHSAQAGLDSIEAEGPVWTHFPNTQRALLRYRNTMYYGMQAETKGNLIPFRNQALYTTTNLTTSGGGAALPADDNTVAYGKESFVDGYDFKNPYLLQLRMTSPYNIVKSCETLDSGYKSEPNWIGLFDSKYQYYQVKKTDWGVTLTFGVPQLDNGAVDNNLIGAYQNYRLKVFWRYTNQDEPPVKWTYSVNRNANIGDWSNNAIISGQYSEDKASVTKATPTSDAIVPLTSDDYERMGNWKCKTVHWNTTRGTTVHLGGTYKFGQCKMDVKTLLHSDAAGAQTNPTAEGMSLTKSTPQFPEILSIIIVQDCATCMMPDVKTEFTAQIDTSQLVDFVDLRGNFKFPTPNLCTTASTYEYTDEQFFTRGAGY